MSRPTNAPYEPQFYPKMPDPWRRYLARFLKFCEWLPIDPKEGGVVWRGTAWLILLSSQRYLIEEIFWGLSQGCHDFVIVKARQLGASTILWALDLWWLMTFKGLQAMYIADDEGNKEIHRGTITAMYEGLLTTRPASTRGPFTVNNRLESRWKSSPKWRASRLMWAYVNRRAEGRLGISRGINYVHGTEIDTWDDEDGVAALQASLADRHPRRLYLWEGTGRGYGLLYAFWTQAESSTTSRRIFVGFWRRADYVKTREDRAIWRAYGAPPAEPHELEWAREVKRRFGHTITREQLCWWRWKKAEGKGIDGDEAKALEQYPWIPEHAFQAAGSSFVSSIAGSRLRREVEAAPPAQYYRVDWGETFDAKDDPRVEVPKEAATLTIWEEKQPHALYVVAGDPAYGSSPEADSYAVTVWRCYPDSLVQVAEYESPLGRMYEFAWLLAYLAGYYERWLVYDLRGPGFAIIEEFKRMSERGWGMRQRSGRLQDVVGNIQQYLQSRPDALNPSYNWQYIASEDRREAHLETLRNEIERGTVVIRSHDLMTQVTALVRDKKTKRIEAGGIAHDDLAITAMMAVAYWLDGAIADEINSVIAPQHLENQESQDPAARLFSNFFRQHRDPEPEDEPRKSWGVSMIGPGR